MPLTWWSTELKAAFKSAAIPSPTTWNNSQPWCMTRAVLFGNSQSWVQSLNNKPQGSNWFRFQLLFCRCHILPFVESTLRGQMNLWIHSQSEFALGSRLNLYIWFRCTKPKFLHDGTVWWRLVFLLDVRWLPQTRMSPPNFRLRCWELSGSSSICQNTLWARPLDSWNHTQPNW